MIEPTLRLSDEQLPPRTAETRLEASDDSVLAVCYAVSHHEIRLAGLRAPTRHVANDGRVGDLAERRCFPREPVVERRPTESITFTATETPVFRSLAR